MRILVLLVIVIIAITLFKNKKPSVNTNTHTQSKTTEENIQNYNTNNYQKKWMFTYNEKNVYKQIKEIVDQNGLVLFAKVRLLDLVEPKSNVKNNKGYLWKVQAKHVDFVICDQKLVAKYIIELDDNSHDSLQRSERDKFVDEVLQATGYKVLHIRAFDKDLILQFLDLQTPSTTV